MYTDSQEPLKLSSLARIVLLLAVLALAGCSAFRPPLEAPSAPSDDTVMTIILDGLALHESEKMKEFLEEHCLDSLKVITEETRAITEEMKEGVHWATYKYTPCSTAQTLEQTLKKKLKEYKIPGKVELISQNKLVVYTDTLPILSETRVKIAGETLEECTNKSKKFLAGHDSSRWGKYQTFNLFDEVELVARADLAHKNISEGWFLLGRSKNDPQCRVAYPGEVLGRPEPDLSTCRATGCQVRGSTFPCPNFDNTEPKHSFQGFNFDPPLHGSEFEHIKFCRLPFSQDNSSCEWLAYKCSWD